MKNTLIHYILPTYNPEAFFKNVFDKLEIYQPLKELISFGINFQAPWTQEQIDKVVEKFDNIGIKVFTTYNTYEKDSYRFPLLKIRQDCAKLNPTAIYYCSIDDDIEYFCSADIYCKIICNCIQYMERYNVGTLILCRDKIRDIKAGVINRLYSGTFTGYGELYRNRFNGNLIPNWWEDQWGNNEDNISGFLSLLDNYEVAAAGVNIANHTLGYKPADEQVGAKYKLADHRGLPGTIVHTLVYLGNRFLGFNHYDFMSKKRLTYISSEFIDYTTPIAKQLENLKLLYEAKCYDIDLTKNSKRFNPYNFINYNIITYDFNNFKDLVLDNLYLFSGVGEFCSFSLWCPEFTDEQIIYTINKFKDNKITLNYSKSLYIQLNTYAPIQKIFNTNTLSKSVMENTFKVLIEILPANLTTRPAKFKYLDSYLDYLIKNLIKYMEENYK